MADTIATILELGPERHCFLLLVDSYPNNYRHTGAASRENEIIVYEAELPKGAKGYFTVHGKTVELVSGDKVKLNQSFAKNLGLSNGDPLIVRKIKTAVPAARRVFVEPLSTNDWEILENNASKVENILLDHVRVVWKGQVLPVWIQRSLCVQMKISSFEPPAPCVLLETNTEIVVTPKVRANAPPSSLNLPSKEQAALSNMKHQGQASSTPKERLTSSSEFDNIDVLEPRRSLISPSKSPRSSIKISAAQPSSSYPVQRQSSLLESMIKLIFNKKEEPSDTWSDNDRNTLAEFSMVNLPSRNSVLRVQGMSLTCKLEEYFTVSKSELNRQIMINKQLRTLFSTFRTPLPKRPSAENIDNVRNVPMEIFQPSTIYIDADYAKSERLIHPYLPHLPDSFIARLQRLPSPHEKLTMAQAVGKKVKNETSEPAQTESMDSSTAGSSAGNGTGDQSNFTGSCYVRVVIIDRKAGLTDKVWQDAADEVLSNQPLLYGHVIIPDLLRRQLRLETTSSVWIQTGPMDLVIPRKLCIHVLSQLMKSVGNDMVIAAFINYIRHCANKDHPLVVFQGIFLKFVMSPEVQVEVQLTFIGDGDISNVKAVTLLSEANIDSVQIVVERERAEDKLGVLNSLLIYRKTSDFDAVHFSQKLKHLGGVEDLIQQALLYLHASLASRPLSRLTFQVRGGLSHGIMLITGTKGVGKTSLVKGLCRKMAHLPVLAYVAWMDCKTLRGKNVSTIQKLLEMLFDEAAWREPAIVVLENLEAIVPAPSGPETEFSGEALYAAKNAQVLEGLLRYEIDNNSHMTVIATSLSRSSLHPSLVSARGTHYIQRTFNIGSPDQIAREKILYVLMDKHSGITKETLKTLELTRISSKTEGYVARDLETLVNQAVHFRMSRDREGQVSNQYTLTTDDFDEVLSTYKPVSLRNVPLHQAGELGWVDVGGLTHVKNVLIETLKWPSKYPKLFSSCSLRLRSGILLYGAPGTGKTLLAGVVARECALNFISVKGPELLNKYIGASEQAVRDLFTKAQRAKPCILFFDEFDSIAPKRGHDSTGVTDRVVNQLLTQLDGVEGLQGVYVLAATSRPDLIDPALLRPGRLDISLQCTIPDQAERHNILVALTHKMSLATDVDLKEIATLCEHFTGADLKALLYNAQLKVIHEHTDIQGNPLHENVVWIKENTTQCGTTTRRASVIKHESGALTLSLSPKPTMVNLDGDRCSPSGDSQSPKRISRSSELQSPHLRSNSASSNRSPKGTRVRLDSDKDETDSSPAERPRSRSQHAPKKIFEFSFSDEKNSPDMSHPDKLPSIASDTDVQKLGLVSPLASFVNSELSHDSLSPLQAASHALAGLQAVGIQQVPSVQTSADVFQSVDYTADQSQGISSERTRNVIFYTEDPGENDNVIISQERSEVAVPPLELKNGDESSFKLKSPESLDSISLHRMRRSYESTEGRARSNNQNNSRVSKSWDSQMIVSPLVDRPVTVFSSLEKGLATLSAEDEAKYLAMVKEIQHRDEILFEAANAKRRTSLKLESKSASLMEVSHRHLVEAAKSMKPSVSATEREKYNRIYGNFVASRKGGFEKPPEEFIGQRATLA